MRGTRDLPEPGSGGASASTSSGVTGALAASRIARPFSRAGEAKAVYLAAIASGGLIRHPDFLDVEVTDDGPGVGFAGHAGSSGICDSP